MKLQAVLGLLAKPRINTTESSDGRRVEEPDGRTYGQRMHDALEAVCDWLLRTDTVVPERVARRRRWSSPLTWPICLDRTGHAVASDGTLISTEKALDLADQADVYFAVVNAMGVWARRPLHPRRSAYCGHAVRERAQRLFATDAAPVEAHHPAWGGHTRHVARSALFRVAGEPGRRAARRDARARGRRRARRPRRPSPPSAARARRPTPQPLAPRALAGRGRAGQRARCRASRPAAAIADEPRRHRRARPTRSTWRSPATRAGGSWSSGRTAAGVAPRP